MTPESPFTQKEMLVRIDGKLDAALSRLAVLETKQAVHEGLDMHDGTAKRVASLEKDVRETRDATKRMGPILTLIITIANGAAVAVLANIIGR